MMHAVAGSAMMTGACPRCGLLHPQGTPCFALSLPASGEIREELPPGAPLGRRYRIVHTIHQGGMSNVYLADDLLMPGCQVAIKELRLPDGASAADVLESEAWFSREASLLSALKHPLIPTFHCWFQDHGRSYIVQEFIQGENLDQLVERRGQLDADLVAGWGVALCGLLMYLHGLHQPVVFRDLKPANILLCIPQLAVAVVDFGIARPYHPGQVSTIVGTPGYAPPEQYQGLASPQSDIYALGVTLHRLLTAHDPEHGQPFTFPTVQSLNPKVPLELATIVERALQLNPADRFTDAEAMGAAIELLVRRTNRETGLTLIPAARQTQIQPVQVRHRALFFALAPVSALIGLMMAGLTVHYAVLVPLPLLVGLLLLVIWQGLRWGRR